MTHTIITNNTVEDNFKGWDASLYEVGEDLIFITNKNSTLGVTVWVNNQDYDTNDPKDNVFEVQVAKIDKIDDSYEVEDILFEDVLDFDNFKMKDSIEQIEELIALLESFE